MIEVKNNTKTEKKLFSDMEVGTVFICDDRIRMKIACLEHDGTVRYHGVELNTGHSSRGESFYGPLVVVKKAVLTIE